MAKDKITRKRAKPTREVSVEAVMLHARAIIEQGRTKEFLTACKEGGYSMRGSAAFLSYAQKFARSGSATTISAAAPNKFTAAVAAKKCGDDITGD